MNSLRISYCIFKLLIQFKNLYYITSQNACPTQESSFTLPLRGDNKRKVSESTTTISFSKAIILYFWSYSSFNFDQNCRTIAIQTAGRTLDLLFVRCSSHSVSSMLLTCCSCWSRNLNFDSKLDIFFWLAGSRDRFFRSWRNLWKQF